jgi:hypothetical protein
MSLSSITPTVHNSVRGRCVVNSDRYQADVFEGIIDHLPCSVVEHGASFNVTNSIHQIKMFLHARHN